MAGNVGVRLSRYQVLKLSGFQVLRFASSQFSGHQVLTCSRSQVFQIVWFSGSGAVRTMPLEPAYRIGRCIGGTGDDQTKNEVSQNAAPSSNKTRKRRR